MKALFLILFFMSSCGPQDITDFRSEGTALVEAGSHLLARIQTKEELYENQAEIRGHFVKIFSLLRRVEIYRREHPDEEVPFFTLREQKASDQFLNELNRILTLPGGEEVLLKLQAEALVEIM